MPQSVAGRTGPERVVERKQPRLDLIDGETTDRTGELSGEGRALLGFGVFDDHQPVGEFQRRFEAVRQTLFHAVLQHHTIDHNFDGVLILFVERGCFFDQVHDIVDLDPLEAAFLQFGQFFAVFPLTTPNNGSEQVKPRAFAHSDRAIHHLGDGLALNRQARCGGVGNADPCKQ